MRVIGIAGPIGAGKSSVANALRNDVTLMRDLGGQIECFNADDALRAARNEGGPLREAIGALVPAAERSDGSLDAVLLADAVFSDPALLKKLELVQWPVARAALHAAQGRAAASGAALLLVEAIALLDSGLAEVLDGFLVLDAPLEVRQSRALGRGTSAAEFTRRDAAQAGLTGALLAAGGVKIDARGSLGETVSAAAKELRLLCSTDEPHPDPAN
jgi:dephospho-CoA kinase